MITTEVWEVVNKVIQLEINPKMFDVGVVEEQVVITGHVVENCSCKGNPEGDDRGTWLSWWAGLKTCDTAPSRSGV